LVNLLCTSFHCKQSIFDPYFQLYRYKRISKIWIQNVYQRHRLCVSASVCVRASYSWTCKCKHLQSLPVKALYTRTPQWRKCTSSFNEKQIRTALPNSLTWFNDVCSNTSSKSSSCAKNPNNLHLHNGWVFSLWNLVPPPYIITIGHWDLWTTCSTVY